jgi:tetratricopeptide (TPR) repeat protein
MAPEQHAGDREIDARADQFGFCVALYEALYGVRPFAGDDGEALRAAIAAGSVAPGGAGRDVPGWLRRVVLRGLAADPDARFPSMTALLGALAHEPRHRRRRWWIGGAVLAALGAALAAAQLGGADRGARCRVDPARFAGVWDAPRRAAMQAAFAHSGAPGAPDTWGRVERALEDRVRGWQRMWTDACEATHVRGEQSPVLLDLRMACLDDRHGELRALSDLLVTADRVRVEHAVDAVRGLERLDACARAQALHAGRRSTDPGTPGRRERWARVQATSLVGDRPRALELARSLAGDARAAGDRELEAEALRSVGQLLTAKGEAGAAEDALYGAIAAAQAADADALAARAWLDLAWLVGEETSRYADAHHFTRVAQGAIDRIGGSPPLEAVLEDRIGVLYYDQAQYADAAPHLERGLALRELLFGPASTEAAASLQHLAMLRTAEGKKPAALELHHRARQIAERMLGPAHPDALAYAVGEAAALFDLGRDDESLAVLSRTLAQVLRNDPDDGRNAADLLSNISTIQRKRGDLAGARASQERAVAMLERVAGADSPLLAVPLSNLALILSDLGAHDDALARIDRALALQAKALGADHPDVADTLSSRGTVLIAAHRPAQAIAPLERAIAIRARLAGAVAEVAADRFRLARALVASHGKRDRALELVSAARAAFVAERDTTSVQEIDTWRAELGRAR